MSNPEIVSEFKNSSKILYSVGIILLTFLSYLSFSKFNANDFKTYGNLAGVICFTSFLIWIFYYIISTPKIYFYSNKIEIHKFLGIYKKTLLLDKIKSWFVIEKESKYGNYEILYLIDNNNKIIKINGFEYSNFIELRLKIVRSKPENKILKKEVEQKNVLKILIIASLFGVFFVCIANQFYQNSAILSRNDVQVVKGILSEDIRLEHSRKSRSLVIKLENLSDFEFIIGSVSLDETYYQDLMKDFKKGNKIYLTIEKEEYQKKIAKTNQLTFLDKYFHYEKIDVVEVENKNFKYLSLSDFNNTHKNNDYWGIGFFSLLGLFLIIFGVYGYFKEMK